MTTKPILLLFLLSCASTIPAKTPESMLAYRYAHGLLVCERECPIGHELPYDPTLAYTPVTQCCVDPNGMTWSLCAWNGAGRFATLAQLMDPTRLRGDCGGDGYPDCAP